MSPRIMAPFNSPDEVNELAESGADELYCGVVDEEWVRKYPIAGINRRVELHSNLKSFSDLQRSVRVAHSYNVTVSLAINEHYYTLVQYPSLLEYVKKAVDTGIDSFIVADIGLILLLREKCVNVPLHLSTGGAVFNSKAAKFYSDLGISRITIPRHLTLNEFRALVKNIPGIETAVFILNSRCANIDGLCTFDHTPFKCQEPAKFLGPQKMQEFPEHAFSKDIFATGCCNLPYIVELDDSDSPPCERDYKRQDEKASAALIRQSLWDRHHIDNIPCGACALYEFSDMGIAYVKIVGRGNTTLRKVSDIAFIRMLLTLLEHDDIGVDEFRQSCRDLYRANYKRICQLVNCYYPEVFPEKAIGTQAAPGVL